MPAPYAFSDPSSTTTPNSTVNQNTRDRKRRFSSSAQAVGRLAGQPVQLRERRRGQQVPVADDLVDDVRLGRVERARRVAHVLGRVEQPVRQRPVELAQRHQPRRRRVVEARQRPQPVADQVEARHAVGRQVERGLRGEELVDRQLVVLGRQLARRPCARPPARPRCSGPGAPADPASTRARAPRSRCAGPGSPDRRRRGGRREVDGHLAVLARSRANRAVPPRT